MKNSFLTISILGVWIISCQVAPGPSPVSGKYDAPDTIWITLPHAALLKLHQVVAYMLTHPGNDTSPPASIRVMLDQVLGELDSLLGTQPPLHDQIYPENAVTVEHHETQWLWVMRHQWDARATYNASVRGTQVYLIADLEQTYKVGGVSVQHQNSPCQGESCFLRSIIHIQNSPQYQSSKANNLSLYFTHVRFGSIPGGVEIDPDPRPGLTVCLWSGSVTHQITFRPLPTGIQPSHRILASTAFRTELYTPTQSLLTHGFTLDTVVTY